MSGEVERWVMVNGRGEYARTSHSNGFSSKPKLYFTPNVDDAELYTAFGLKQAAKFEGYGCVVTNIPATENRTVTLHRPGMDSAL